FAAPLNSNGALLMLNGKPVHIFYDRGAGSNDVVLQPNLPPTANNDHFNVTGNVTLTVPAPGVLGNDTDPDGDTLTVTAVTQPASGHGWVTINADGALTYTQTVFVNGTETFTYAISDGHGGT